MLACNESTVMEVIKDMKPLFLIQEKNEKQQKYAHFTMFPNLVRNFKNILSLKISVSTIQQSYYATPDSIFIGTVSAAKSSPTSSLFDP